MGPIYPRKECKIAKSKNFSMKKIYPSGYPNMQKSRLYLVSILNKKYNYFLRYFSYFLVKVGVWSKVKRSKSKSNLAYAGVITPGVQNMQRVRSHHFPVLSLWCQRSFCLNFNPLFSSLAAFLGATSEHWTKIGSISQRRIQFSIHRHQF